MFRDINWLPIVLITAHFVGDWYFQPPEMAANKSKDLLTLIRHIVRVTAVLVVFLLPFINEENAARYGIGLLVYAFAHGVQDWNIWGWYSRKFGDTDRLTNTWFWKTIATDQLIHLTLLLIIFQ